MAFDERAKKATKSLEAFKEAEAAASSKKAELEAAFVGNPAGLQKAMSEAPEFTRYQQELTNIGIPSLLDSLVVALTKIGIATEDAVGSIDSVRVGTSNKINDLLEKNLDVLRARRHQMFVWSRMLSLDNQKLPELLEFRDQGFQLTKALFKKWQLVYMSALFAYLDGRKETGPLADVLSESQALQKKFGSNYLLEAIERRTAAFRAFLEKEKL